MTTNTTDLIERSTSHNEIAHAAWTQELHDELVLLADDSVQAEKTIWDYWGTDEDGRDWRVELRVEEPGGEEDGWPEGSQPPVDWLICSRCDRDLTDDVTRHLDEGGPDQCSHCGLTLPTPPAAWLVANGYNVGEEGE